MSRLMTLIVVLTLTASPMLLGQSPDVSVTVEKMASPQAQIAHARKLMRQLAVAKAPRDKHIAVANAAANLMAVERTWPDARPAIIEANALLAQLYVDGQMPRNAIEAAEHGLELAPNDYRLHAAAARSHERFDRKEEAAAAYSRVLATFDARGADTAENLKALNAAAFFFEKAKQHEKSAAALRHACRLDDLMPVLRVVLCQRALEQSVLTADRGGAKKDLVELEKAYRAALAITLTSAQQQTLNSAQDAIERFQTMLK